ncbi:MAG: tetratricopeptide repeat protein [Candidatus Solibacter usitatus]|nr:tetratricopeptide repeat protein [Candidatus Solibacter usitatus]
MARVSGRRACWFLLPAVAAAAEPGYVDPAACRPCHSALYDSFQKTGMGRSFSKTVAPAIGTFYHRASNRQYQVLQRAGEYFLRRSQLDAKGEEVNVLERRIDYAMGSGDHARSFLHRKPGGQLVELPLSWYGFWAMSPGYDRADHLDFRREISDDCLFCHNGYPSAANGGLAGGIDCQRCHGPGERHLREPSRATIVNPARLPAERRMEVCLQCHLETESRGIPDAIRRAGRSAFSYRPGEPLGGYKIYFDHAPGSGRDDKFEINHAAYRLLKSKCRPLLCTTCHDPHQAEPPKPYREVCQGCHRTAHAAASTGCVGCHMPKRRTEDAVHVAMTDHLIQRRPPIGEPLAGRREDHTPYRGPLVQLYPPQADPLYLAVAQVREANNLERGIAMLESAPGKSAFAFDLGEAYRRAGNLERAVRSYRQALEREPDSAKLLRALGDALLRQGKTRLATGYLERARDKLSLAIAYGQQGRVEDSLRLLREAVEENPDAPLAWLNLGVTLEQAGKSAEAEAAYREAIRVQPDFTEARHHLNKLRTAR